MSHLAGPENFIHFNHVEKHNWLQYLENQRDSKLMSY